MGICSAFSLYPNTLAWLSLGAPQRFWSHVPRPTWLLRRISLALLKRLEPVEVFSGNAVLLAQSHMHVCPNVAMRLMRKLTKLAHLIVDDPTPAGAANSALLYPSP